MLVSSLYFMLNIWLYTLISVLVVSLISLLGVVFISLELERLKSLMALLVSFSAGALFGDAFLHLIPEIADEHGFGLQVSLSILVGIVTLFMVEKIIHWHHCHHLDCNVDDRPIAMMNLIGDFLHNIIDGLVIGASYLISIPVGIATTVAVAIHEIPQEIGDYGVLIHGGFSKKKALFFNFFSALGAVVGAVLALLLSSSMASINVYLISFSAGIFIYIAGSDLIPELHKRTGLRVSIEQLLLFVAGIAIMYWMLFV